MLTTTQQIEKVLKEALKIDHIDPSLVLKEQGLDSLDLVEIMVQLEEEFEIEFTNDEMLGFVTVGEVIDTINEKVAKK